MPMDWEENRRYGHTGRGYVRGSSPRRGHHERNWDDRAGDEVRSWFGDDDAERRRREDDRRFPMRDYARDYSEEDSYAGRGFSYGGYYAPASYERYYLAAPAGYGPADYDDGGLYGAGPYKPRSYMERRYGSPGDYRRDGYQRNEDRGFFERAGDEVASWFGSEDAQRRREMDARFRGSGPKNYTRSDDRIHEDVCNRLSDDPYLDASDIEVSVNSGEVTLDGTVNDRLAKRRAEDLSEMALGVKHVQNNLRRNEQKSGSVSGTTAASTRH